MYKSYFSNNNRMQDIHERYLKLSVLEQWLACEHSIRCIFMETKETVSESDLINEVLINNSIILLMGSKLYGDENKIARANAINFLFTTMKEILASHPDQMSTIVEIERFVRTNLISESEQLEFEKRMENK